MLDESKINKTYVSYKVYSVIKLKNKYGFRIKFVFSNGDEDIQQIGGFNRKKDANAERDNVIAQLKNHTYIMISNIRFRDYIRYWLEMMRKREEKFKYNSYMSYRNVIENYAISFFGELYLAQINLGHIQRFYNYVTSKHKSVARIAKSVIVTAFEYAKTKNLVSTNPAKNIELPKIIEAKPCKIQNIDVDKTLNIEQIKLLIQKSKETPIYLHILFAVLMGLRKQEINGLKYSDIDFINRKLHLQRQLGVDPKKSKEECAKKTYTKQEIALKTYSSQRILDIPDMVFEAILEEKKRYERNKSRRINDKYNPFQDLGYICCSTYGHPRSKGFHVRYYKALLQENNLPQIRFHDLRHTFATLLLMNNYNLKAVSQLLGHASTIITANVYFDQEKVVIDCVKEITQYINKVKPKDVEEGELNTIKLDTNLVTSRFIE